MFGQVFGTLFCYILKLFLWHENVLEQTIPSSMTNPSAVCLSALRPGEHLHCVCTSVGHFNRSQCDSTPRWENKRASLDTAARTKVSKELIRSIKTGVCNPSARHANERRCWAAARALSAHPSLLATKES